MTPTEYVDQMTGKQYMAALLACRVWFAACLALTGRQRRFITPENTADCGQRWINQRSRSARTIIELARIRFIWRARA